jgi:chemotaxis methyl-accepting protein methylase
LLRLSLRINRAIWKRLPGGLRNSRPGRWYGSMLHARVAKSADRHQYFGTSFLRNRPQLEHIRRIAAAQPHGASFDLAVLGCSIGAEVYSVLWTIRSARPDLEVRTVALDISAEVLAVAERAVYSSDSAVLAGWSIFERLSEAEREQIFDWQGNEGTVKPWIRQGVRFQLGSAADPGIARTLGPQDLVLASNFLCHMEPTAAQRCLRNIARLVKPGGHLLVTGVDLDVREELAREFGWQPVPDLIREIHEGDPDVRRDWPWEWWGLEPLDDRRRDWQLRYGTVFRVPEQDRPRP